MVRSLPLLSFSGPSGGGKTTLLNVLAGRVTNIKKAELTGQLLVKDQPRNESDFKSQASEALRT
jgi:ATP-binding cassette subfamily G (WHITE) protein 2